MQTTNAAFTAEEKDTVRTIAESLLVSWKRDNLLSNRTFTIGVSTIGGNDIIGINVGAIGSPGNYRYFDETAYLTSLAYERGFNMPTGGLAKAMAEARLDNTSGRFTPRYMGGVSELHTAILPERPMIISTGFKVNGVDQVLPQFSGLISEQPKVDTRNKTLDISGEDYIRFFESRYLDQEVMFTFQRTDQVMETMLAGSLGMSTAQYELDTGVNLIPFGLFEKGTRMSEIFHQLAESENGHFYQDEEGKFRFENRQHWDSSPFTTVQKIIYTADVINAESPNTDHLINVVEINSNVYAKQANQVIFQLSTPLLLPSGTNTELFINFDDPILQMQTITGYTVFTNSDGTGTDITTSVSVKSTDLFAKALKVIFLNASAVDGYMTQLYIYGRPAKKSTDLYYRAQDDSSVTAYNERVLRIDNGYIQNESWAASYSRMILNDFSNIENLQILTILARPDLQLGDLISWQGRYWRIFDIKTTLSPSVGFVQELTLLQRTITTYFRIGISTIGGTDKIAP